MNRQEIFDLVSDHLITQGQVAVKYNCPIFINLENFNKSPLAVIVPPWYWTSELSGLNPLNVGSVSLVYKHVKQIVNHRGQIYVPPDVISPEVLYNSMVENYKLISELELLHVGCLDLQEDRQGNINLFITFSYWNQWKYNTPALLRLLSLLGRRHSCDVGQIEDDRMGINDLS